ncbi:MAG: tRNA 2-thiouridine(34) synthase MnmA, partial [Candidatus Nealsonbacteria bacterium]|nr:tRNA 2-thiouridine(34) synthase MnmA [Candidatus Nealsonbacteria bacterium]
MRKIESRNNKKVVVAMSGGIDSSVAAALLKKQGYNIVGVFMKFWKEPDGQGGWNRCCSPDSERRARMVAKILGIPFYVFNFEKEFKKRIVDEFLKGYKEGITPNPCVICNKEIKFGLLLKKALELNADFIATGHYARLRQGKLYRGGDEKKDQSYFLWQLDQSQLKKVLFPVGSYTKNYVRKLAKKFKLPVLNIPESMEICFVPDKLDDFLKRYLKPKPGLIMTSEGKEIGRHQGLPFYTIGQRKGIELSGGPYYVVGKDTKKNILIVAPILKDSALWSKSLVAKFVNWISGKTPKLPLKVNAQIRYGHRAVPAVITE